MTQHIGLTLELEQSLQSINPAIALPYYEYGQDYYLYDYWFNSVVYEADWFGEAVPLSSTHSIGDSGRWDGVFVPDGTSYIDGWNSNSTSLNPYVNAYGDLRSPWNNNPSRGRLATDTSEHIMSPKGDVLQA